MASDDRRLFGRSRGDAGAGDEVVRGGARAWWALGALAVCGVVIGMDATVLNLALPTLAGALRASPGDLLWFASAYTLAFAVTLLPAGLAGDRYGARPVMLAGLAAFALASAGCAAAGSAPGLIAARAAAGAAAAVVTALSVAVIPVLFGQEQRPAALAVSFGAAVVSYPFGPLLGGWLLTRFWWGWAFLVNVPLIAVSLAAVAFFLPRSPGRRRGRADVPGAVLSGGGLAAVTYGVIAAGQQGWASGTALAAGAGLLAAFWRQERRAGRTPGGPARQPLIDPALFASRGFTAGTALVTMTALVMFGLSYAMPQYFRDVAGASPIGAGVQLLPVAGGSAAGLLAATRLQRPRRGAARTRLSPRAAAAAGFAVMAAGTGAGAATVPGSSAAFTAAWFAVTGFGLGFIPPSAMNAALAAVPPERAGSGAALISALRFAGATIGTALLGTLLAAGYRSDIQAAALPAADRDQAAGSVTAGLAAARARHSPALLHVVRAAFTSGLDTTLLACSAIAVVAAVLAVAFLPRQAR